MTCYEIFQQSDQLYKGELFEAQTHIDTAIRLWNKSAAYYFHKGNIELKLGHFKESHENYDIAIELEPGNARYYH